MSRVSFMITLSVSTDKVEEWPVLFESLAGIGQEMADRYPSVSISFNRVVDDEAEGAAVVNITHKSGNEE